MEENTFFGAYLESESLLFIDLLWRAKNYKLEN